MSEETYGTGRETVAEKRSTWGMGDGRLNRAIEQGKARTTEIKTRVPDLKDRMPELKERVPELGNELRTKGTELRTKGTELRTRGGELARQYAKMDVSWARCGYARALREGLLSGVLGPLTDCYLRRRTVGRAIFDERLTPPVIFVANHSSHLDTPTILRAMPRKWRNRTAVAAAADYFYKKRWTANGVALLFNTVPLGRKGGGLENGATDHVDRLIGQRWNLLMFPEGTRSRDGVLGKVHTGAAVIAARHGIDIVPIYVDGTHDAMPPGQNWPKRRRGRIFSRRHRVEVRFGEPIAPRDASLRREVMDEVREFWDRKGLPADPQASAKPAEHDVLIIHSALMAHEATLAERRTGRFDPLVPVLSERSEDRSTPAA
jgi:1-acyl-sn-glycerol-3-phosphate acyltransferase